MKNMKNTYLYGSNQADNKHRAATKKYVSSVTREIFGEPVRGYSYAAA